MSALSIPSVRCGIVQDTAGTPTVKHVNIPNLPPTSILIKTHAVALNPTDNKMPASFPTPGALIGCDFAGVVVAMGSEAADITTVRIGDRVAGAVHGSNRLDHESGAFAEYVRAEADLVWQVPNHMSWEDAAAIGGTGHGTLCLALWGEMKLGGRPESPCSVENKEFVLIYGGSTATGTMALQLLKLSGFIPITTCSPHNFALAKRYGASVVFDYASPTVATDIRVHTKNSLFYILDCITDEHSVSVCYGAMGRAGGKYVCLEACPPQWRTRKAIHMDFLMGYEMFGKDVLLDQEGVYSRKARPERKEMAVEWYKTVSRLAKEKKIKAHPVEVVDGMWDGVIRAMGILKKGGVSGKKLVVRVG